MPTKVTDIKLKVSGLGDLERLVGTSAKYVQVQKLLENELKKANATSSKYLSTVKLVLGIGERLEIQTKKTEEGITKQTAALQINIAAKEKAAAAAKKLAISESEAASKMAATAAAMSSKTAQRVGARLTRVTSTEGGTVDEITRLKESISAVREYVKVNEISYAKVEQIRKRVAEGDIRQYDKQDAALQKHLQAVKKANDQLGASGRKLAAQRTRLHAQAIAEDRRLNAVRATLHAQAIAEDRKRQASSAALVAQRKHEAAALLALQARTKALSVSGGAAKADVISYHAQITKLREYVRANKISAEDINRIWGRVKDGNIRTYGRVLDGLQSKMYKLQNATALSTTKAKKHVESLILSWKNMSRLIVAQLVRRAISSFLISMRRAIDETRQFSMAIAELRTISQSAQLSQEQWREGILSLSDAFGFTALDQAEAAYQTLSNQVAEGAKTFEFLAEANKFAVTAATDSATAVNLLTAAINSFGMTTNDTEHIAAVLFKTIEQGRVRASEMANSLGDVGILAHQLGVTLEELTATISTLTINGVKYNKASTQLRGIMIKLIKPTKEMKKFFRELGVATGEQAIQVYGLSGFLAEMAKRTKGSTTELGKLINRVRGISGALALTGNGFETFQKNLALNIKSMESYKQAAKDAFDNVGRRATILQQRLKNVFVREIGVNLLDGIVKFSESVGGLDTVLSGMIKTIASLPAVLALAGAAVTLLTRRLIAMAAANPAGAILVGFTLLATGITAALNKMVDDINKLERAEVAARKRAVQRAKKQVIATHRIFLQSAIARVGITSRAIASMIGAENKYFDKVAANYVKLDKVVKKTYASIIKSATKALSKMDKAIDKSRSALSTIESDIVDLALEQVEFKFELKLKGLDDVGKLKELRAEIQRVQKIASEEARGGDTASASETLKRTLTLWDKISDINDRIAERKEKQEEDLQNLQTKGVEDVGKASEKLVKIREAGVKKILDIENKIFIIRQQIAARDEAKRRGLTTDRQETGSSLGLQLAKAQGKLAQARYSLEDKLTAAVTARNNIEFKNTEAKRVAKQLIEKTTAAEISQNDIIKEKDKLIAGIQKMRYEMLAQERTRLQLMEKERAILRANSAELTALVGKTAGYDVTGKTADELSGHAKLLERQLVLAKRMNIEESVRTKEIKEQIAAVQKLATTTVRTDELQKAAKNIQIGLETFKKTVAAQKAVDVEIAKNLAGRQVTSERELTALLAAVAKAKASAIGDLPALPTLGTSEIKERIKDLTALEAIIKKIKLDPKAFKDVAAVSAALAQLQTASAIPFNAKDLVVSFGLLRVNLENIKKILIDQTATGNLQTQYEDLAKKYSALTAKMLKTEAAAKETQKATAGTASNYISIVKSMERLNNLLNFTNVDAKKNFATGGQVGQDTVPAMLSPGEFVMNASASKRFYSQLQTMNNQPVQRFADGGPVNNYGDFNISVPSNGNKNLDIVAIGRGLQRAIRQRSVKL